MKTKIKRHSRSVLSVILAVALLFSSSITAMFIANAVTLPKEAEEEAVGASIDYDSSVGVSGNEKLYIGQGSTSLSYVGTISTTPQAYTLKKGNNWVNICWDNNNGTSWNSQYVWYDSSSHKPRWNVTGATGVNSVQQAENSGCYYILINVKSDATYNFAYTGTSASDLTLVVTGGPNPICTTLTLTASPSTLTTADAKFTLTASTDGLDSGLSGKTMTYSFLDESDHSVGSVSSSTGGAVLTGLTQDVRTKQYKVTVSYSGYETKTSSLITVTNTSFTEPGFKLVGEIISDWNNGQLIDQVDSSYGANVYYKEITVTETGTDHSKNRFRLKNATGTYIYSADGTEDGNKRTQLAIDGDPFELKSYSRTENYLQFNPTEAGTYRIYVDQTSATAPKVWITGERDVFITSVTDFNDYVDDHTDPHVVLEADVSNFESSTNTKFKGYKSGAIFSSTAIIDKRPFMISDSTSVAYDVEYTVRPDLCVGVDFTLDHALVGDAEDGKYAQIYQIKSNSVKGSDGSTDVYTKNIILHIDKVNMEIWATSTFDQTQVAKTAAVDSDTITYYFAKVVGNNYDGNAAAKDGNANGIKIYYWNNSLDNSSFSSTTAPYGGVATGVPVKKDGTTVSSSGDDNSIYVDLSNPIAYEIPKAGGNLTYKSGKGWTGDDKHNAKAYIYKVSIPSWATSFAWADSNGSPYWQASSSFSQPGPVLNPNRVYVFYEVNNSYYTVGVRLDDTLWDENSAAKDDEAAKFIKYETTNVIKYNADENNDLNPAMNAKLVDVYKDRGIANELYFGSFHNYSSTTAPTFNDSKKPITWKAWNNLAQRKNGDSNKYTGNCSYFASIWDLTGGILDLSQKQGLGNFALTDTYQKAELPLFDYELLTTASNGIATAVYQGVDFPFYKNTYNGVTSYSYDSISDFNREFNETTQKYSVNTTAVATLNNMQAYKPLNQKESFANEFIIKFYMTESGKLKAADGSDQDITFNFSGDDDVWVYIDGVKVLDLGGAHMISAGSINLSDMKTYYRSPAMSNFDTNLNATNEDYATSASSLYTVDIQKLFDVYGIKFDKKDATTQHTLQMFYVERGQNESNCSISFNLPQNSGLRIQNEIDTSDINPGLVNDTLKAANKDYFQYYIESSLATDAQRTTALGYTSYGISNIPERATGLQDSTFYSDTPKFPANNPATINRVSQGETQLLLTGGISNGAVSVAPSLSESYISTGNLNYKLTEANYSGVITNPLSGRTTTSTNGATLNLLYGQAATFDSKITPHTWLVVKQQNELYLPSNNESTIIRGANVATNVAPGDQRNASRFYTTTYTITDDAANKTINTVASSNNREVEVVAHAADNETGYYYSNYSNTTDTTENVAATYKFVNKPNIGEINITKQIDSGAEAPNLRASFWFDVTFDNIFGIDDGDNVFESKNIKYRVINEDGSYVERDYNTTGGIMLRHNQTAQILGIPSGTLYKVTERSRGGYQLDTVTKTSYRNGVLKNQTVMTDSAQYEKSSDIDYRGASDDGAYLADFVYVNKKVSMKVVLHYYDRKMQNGVPVDIDTTPTTATVGYSDAPKVEGKTFEKIVTSGDTEELIWINTEEYIANAVEGKLGNVVDNYFYWTTNTKAKAGIQDHKSISYSYNDSTGRYDESLKPYAETAYHLDAYGKPLTSRTEADRWVTYYDASGNDLTEQFTDTVITDESGTTPATVTLYNKLSEIHVWVFNEPKKYTVTVYGAADSTQLTDVNDDGSVMVGNGGGAGGSNKGTITDYYNTRFGETAGASSPIDGSSNYMQQYGRETSFTGKYPTDKANVQRVIGDYKFVGWATDPEGKNIFTNDYYCGYRILSDMSLYPVYMKNPTTGFGLTITPNVKDTYIASNGTEYTRLNVTYNPYNVTGDNDTNITEIAMVNIRMANTFDVSDINLDTVRTKVKDALDALQLTDNYTHGAHKITVEVKGNSNNDLTKPVRNEYNANELDYAVSFEDLTESNNTTTVKLNNKNRVMLTQTYNSSLLANNASCYKLLVLGAMKYNNVWTISNNYLYYVGGVCQ